jgi:hypothetical protein
MIIREGFCAVARAVRRGVNLDHVSNVEETASLTYNLARLKTPLTFKSKTFCVLESGVGSKGPPHVAPALQIRMSRCPAVSFTLSTSTWISSVFATLAEIPTALPLMPGSLFSFSTAWLIPCSPSSFRAVMKTMSAPESRNAVAVCKPRPRDPMWWSISTKLRAIEAEVHLPPVTRATLPSRRNMELKFFKSDILRVFWIYTSSIA